MGDAADRLARFFDGESLETKSSLAACLVTVGDDGWPHTAMVSVGELLIDSDGTVRLAMWSGSRSTANIVRNGQVVLLVVLEGRAIRARLTARPVESDEELTYFAGTLVAADADSAPYADLLTGVTFEPHDRAGTLSRWVRTIDRLRSGGGSGPGMTANEIVI